ncbi:hypothetical protein [Levilactobacillus paucivorans]|uniref:hypothetical protein n=1 Tax=Levilactobacillus paucivorans TaxID=616990 RepID=UPI00070C7FC0|nr:hypothetical protein [Levilactobacillus paucivorans]
MGKFSKIAVTAVTVLLVGGAVPTTASAASWHKGTPKALRGSWKRSYKQNGAKQTIHFKVTAKSIAEYRTGWASTNLTNVKYQKVSAGTYKLKGTYHNGNLTKKNSHMKIKKSHGKVTYKFSWSSSYSYLGWYHK